jgi:nucleoside-diphosphate-sugar epimerase
VSLNTLFATLRTVVGCDVGPVYEAARVGEVRDSRADVSRARSVLGYAPRVTLEEGLRRTVEWYRRGVAAPA